MYLKTIPIRKWEWIVVPGFSCVMVDYIVMINCYRVWIMKEWYTREVVCVTIIITIIIIVSLNLCLPSLHAFLCYNHWNCYGNPMNGTVQEGCIASCVRYFIFPNRTHTWCLLRSTPISVSVPCCLWILYVVDLDTSTLSTRRVTPKYFGWGVFSSSVLLHTTFSDRFTYLCFKWKSSNCWIYNTV